jgi:hypothetical protein
MKIGFARLHPAPELDPELERPVRLAQKFVFLDAQRAVEQTNRRDGCLPHPDDADVRGLDDSNRSEPVPEAARENGCGHPASGASTDDDDTAQPIGGNHHRSPRAAGRAGQ